tara:strand:+ start:2852 stop:3118 length:267 start_codon:yes stop_codon:yes gene_type:complete
MLHTFTHSKEVAKSIPKENKPTIVTASNARSLSLASYTNDNLQPRFEYNLSPQQFCKYHQQRSRNSDIFNTKETNIDQPPMYALTITL